MSAFRRGEKINMVFADVLYTCAGEPIENALVSIIDDKIVGVRGNSKRPNTSTKTMFAPIVAPGFIDLQINGAMDIQFTDNPSVKAVSAIVEGARKGGTAHVLPTFTSSPGDRYKKALSAVESSRQLGILGILGMHLEGPFLSPEKPGIHDARHIREITEADISNLSEFSGGKLLVTLAPECQADGSIKKLNSRGVVVFAGHSNASSKEIEVAENEGLRGATHLFNAMSQLNSRSPGVVGGVLFSNTLYAGIIPDGHHVSWENIGIAIKSLSGRIFLVTDAMSTLAGTQHDIIIHGKKVRLVNGMLTDDTGRLAGAHISMDACVRNVVEKLNIPLQTTFEMVSKIPAEVLGLDNELGAIKTGYRASMTLLSESCEALGVVVDGRGFE